MSNTSATGGFLQEQSTPLGITTLEDLWHDTICGVTGLDNTLVRPSRQLDPAQQPDALTDWCAFDIVRVSSDPWLDVAHVRIADCELETPTPACSAAACTSGKTAAPCARWASPCSQSVIRSPCRSSIRWSGASAWI